LNFCATFDETASECDGWFKNEKFSTKFGRFLSDGEGGFSDSEFFLSAAPLVIPSNFFPLADDVI
jgi:hypothetical protein